MSEQMMGEFRKAKSRAQNTPEGKRPVITLAAQVTRRAELSARRGHGDEGDPRLPVACNAMYDSFAEKLRGLTDSVREMEQQ